MQKIFKQERSHNGIHYRLLWDLIEKIRRRLTLHETAFTRWRFFTSYFIDVDTFYLFLNWVSTRVSDDRKYVCGRRLYACIDTRKFKGLDSRQITSLPVIKKWFTSITWHVLSIIAENKPHSHHKMSFAYDERLQHPTIAVLLIKILIFFRPLCSVHLLQSNQRFQAIEFVDRHVSENL